MNDIYYRFFGFIGNILMGHPSGVRERLPVLRVMVVLSLLAALGSAVTPLILNETQRSVNLSYALSAIWAMTVIFTIRRTGLRGLWTLSGLPFALYWPALTALLYVSCYWFDDCP